MKLHGFLFSFVSFVAIVLAGPHFLQASGSVDSIGVLHISFEEVGIGNKDVTYLLSATGTIKYQCHILARPITISLPVSVSTPFVRNENGHITGTITGPAPPKPIPPITCLDGIAGAVYTGITLRDTTNSVTKIIPDVTV